MKSIERLLHRGHHEQAEQARGMEHLSAPRPGGALAALESAPDADVVFMAHYGFPDGFGEVWRELPRAHADRGPALARARVRAARTATTSGSGGCSAGGRRSTRGSASAGYATVPVISR